MVRGWWTSSRSTLFRRMIGTSSLYAVVGDRDANVFFRPGMKEQKYEKYREAWHLLVDACQPPAKGPIDIHASCDEEAETRVVREAIERAAVRRMFRGVLQS
jgi:hypothetical protein